VRSTLFHIPHADAVWGIPLFGFGWLLAVVILAGLFTLGYRIARSGWNRDALNDLGLFVVLSIVVVIAQRIEELDVDGQPLGVPIRAYGLLVLLGIAAGITLSVRQAQSMGISPETVFALCFWIVVGGFLGARTFYVVQYWDQFAQPTVRETLTQIINLTDGGLVVYGSFLGAAVAFAAFIGKHRLPALALADLLAPGLMIGLTMGRLGCLMNGCCWGGICERSSLGIAFPQGSPPFVDQLERGLLVGMRLRQEERADSWIVEEVTPGGLAATAGLKSGDHLVGPFLPDELQFHRMRSGWPVPDATVGWKLASGRSVAWSFGQLPPRSRPVYPVQLIASTNAALLCLLLWAYYPFRTRDGEVLALLVTIYPILRIFEEMIRTDESSVFATSFRWTISQWVSSLLLLGAVGLWGYLRSRPPGSELPPPAL
jgi:phosphatidylglycerol:prolipoprotein diacylglycerol transferase